MSASEVGWRALDATRRCVYARRRVRHGDPPRAVPDLRPERIFAAPLPESARERVPADAAAALLRAADSVLAGTWTVFGVPRPDSADPDWFYDPVTGRRAPDRRPAFGIHHRDEAETGNVKQIWELSRHHHVTVLAAAWWLTRDERYADAAARQLRSWWRANPFLTGVHWTSGIEAGVRLISWVWIRRLLDDWPKVGDLFEHDEAALRQLGWHQEFLAAFPSRGSSANNHVLAEAAGALAAACAFPWYDRSPRWRRRAAALLQRELAANTFAEGMNRELATDYHRFVLELALLAAVEADAAGCPLTDATWQLLARMLDAGAALLDVTGRPPRQGDGDEGRGLLIDHPARDPWAIALATGSAVIGAARWWTARDGGVQAALVGAFAAGTGTSWRRRELVRPVRRPHHFAGAGQVVMRSATSDGPEIWCRCDGGPHGFLSIAAHAHADALSIEVRHNGVDVLADPGTYCYHGEPAWREWFRSTAAHNTVEINGMSQAESGGPFLWLTQPRTRTITCDAGEQQPVQTWAAEHDGYQRLTTPVGHLRSVTLDSPRRQVHIVDRVDPAGEVAVALTWQLGPDVDADLHVDGEGARASLVWRDGRSRRRGGLELPAALTWTLHTGETDPVRGWYSPRFGQRVPATSLVGRGVMTAATALVTVLRLP